MEKTVFALVGGAWRAEFFLRIARELPDRFQVCGVVTRSEASGRTLEAAWGVPTYRTVEDLLETCRPSFVVVSVPWQAAPLVTKDLVARGIPVLSETPPAPDLNGLVELWSLVSGGARIQVAEQYQFQPLHAARLAWIQSGRLGTVHEAFLSTCHGYHAMSLMRRVLGVGFANATIRADRWVSPIVAGPGRDGDPVAEAIQDSARVLARLDFGGKVGVYDFSDDQYFSWIRSLGFVARGDRGEIREETLRFLKDFRTPVVLELKRQQTGANGNLEGHHLRGILAGDDWIYTNPLAPGRLSDDEIAVGTCLDKMARYVQTGTEFSSFADAAQDHYLSLMIEKAWRTGETVVTETQPWAKPSR